MFRKEEDDDDVRWKRGKKSSRSAQPKRYVLRKRAQEQADRTTKCSLSAAENGRIPENKCTWFRHKELQHAEK